MSKQFKLNKAPGSDGVFNENLKYAVDCPVFMKKFIMPLIEDVWTSEKVPESWKNSTITLLYKKARADDPKNFRPLSLIHCVSKIIAKIVRSRIFRRYHQVIADTQFGFKNGVGTIDAIYTF